MKWHCERASKAFISNFLRAPRCPRRPHTSWPPPRPNGRSVLNNGVVTRGSSFTRGMESEQGREGGLAFFRLELG